MSTRQPVRTILILSANPVGTVPLRLDKEVREIKAGLQRSKYRKRFAVQQAEAVRPRDIQRAMLDYDPQIIHFCGHGEGEEGLVVEGESGKHELVSAEALADLFSLFADQVECVLLNACYSEAQAKAIAQHIGSVVGMRRAIGDRAAIEFAVSFYDALGAGKSIDFAHKLGCNAIKLVGIPQELVPVLRQKDVANCDRKRVFISYKRNVQPDQRIALEIFRSLSQEHDVFIDQTMAVGTHWVERIEVEIQQADVLIVFLSEHSVHSEMVELEVKIAHDCERTVILPVRLVYKEPFQYPLSQYLDPIHWAFWEKDDDTPKLIAELNQAVIGEPLSIANEQSKKALLQMPSPQSIPRPAASAQMIALERPEGTMDVESNFYVQREKDDLVTRTIQQRGVTIIIKGPRQMGKSSMLNRMMAKASKSGKRVVFLDFQLFSRVDLLDSKRFFQRFCYWLTEELGLPDQVEKYLRAKLPLSQECTSYVGYLLNKMNLGETKNSLVLALDEVDKIFSADFRNDFFAMLRSWCNRRATAPIWKQLDLALVTSTEPYQFIDDLDQSPFNVGEVVRLTDFTPEQVADLNQRHGFPLTPLQEARLIWLLNGHPYLVRRALYLVASQQCTADELFEQAASDRGPFSEHLRRCLFLLRSKQNLSQTFLRVLRERTCPDEKIFWRLEGAGLIRREGRDVLPRCQLYAEYLQEHLRD